MEDSSPRLRQPAAVRPDGRYVVYWMTQQRRLTYNFALDRAVDWARRLGKPLVVFETLEGDYPWACLRFHQFVLDGMRDHAAALAEGPARYCGFVEREPGELEQRLATLVADAAVVVTDACVAPPGMEAVDANGLVPVHATDRAFPTAHGFRRFMQKQLLVGIDMPRPAPFEGGLPGPLPELPSRLELGAVSARIGPVAELPGGSVAGARRLDAFLQDGLPRYLDDRLDLDRPANSGLSPYLRFGHVGTHQVVARLMPFHLNPKANGSREGFWGVDAPAEAFLDQLFTWRELAFNGAAHLRDYTEWESLPGWARATLEEHLADPRPVRYSFDELDQARTHDPIWNAAQRELSRGGRIHNYLRMLWGKKVLEWSASPQEALATLIELNNRYALDGRDPNSYAGIFWCFGRYDRAWGPERPIFGKVRYMTSAQAARKLTMDGYLARWGAPTA